MATTAPKTNDIKIPSSHDWRTTDDDEINRRRRRAREESFTISIGQKLLETLVNKQALCDGVLDLRGDLKEIKLRPGRQAFLAKLEQLVTPRTAVAPSENRKSGVLSPRERSGARFWTDWRASEAPVGSGCGGLRTARPWSLDILRLWRISFVGNFIGNFVGSTVNLATVKHPRYLPKSMLFRSRFRSPDKVSDKSLRQRKEDQSHTRFENVQAPAAG